MVPVGCRCDAGVMPVRCRCDAGVMPGFLYEYFSSLSSIRVKGSKLSVMSVYVEIRDLLKCCFYFFQNLFQLYDKICRTWYLRYYKLDRGFRLKGYNNSKIRKTDPFKLLKGLSPRTNFPLQLITLPNSDILTTPSKLF